jgi:Spy/CpxP family protein refolding chaperone
MKPALIAALLLASAAPVLAQTAPAPPAPPAAPHHPAGGHGGYGHMGARAFPSMSEAGRATIREAMASGGDRAEERARVRAARDKMMAVLEADRLDQAALKRAMDEERMAAMASRERRQAAMLAAFAKLSPEDRKAFVTDSRAMKARMEQRVQGMRERWRQRRMERMAPPAPPQPPTLEL